MHMASTSKTAGTIRVAISGCQKAMSLPPPEVSPLDFTASHCNFAVEDSLAGQFFMEFLQSMVTFFHMFRVSEASQHQNVAIATSFAGVILH